MITKKKKEKNSGEIKSLLVRSILRNKKKLRIMRVTGSRNPRVRKWWGQNGDNYN